MKQLHPARYQNGFTLVELLVSIIIVSYMLVLASVALRNMLLAWDKLAVPYPEEVISFHRLQSVVQSLMPYSVHQSDHYGSRRDSIVFLFNNEKESCSFITASPLMGTGPALIRLYLEDSSFMLAETPIYSDFTDYRAPEENDTTRFMAIEENVSSLQFFYRDREWNLPELEYPYPTLLRLRIERDDGTQTWYSFAVRSDFPEKLQLMQKMDQNV